MTIIGVDPGLKGGIACILHTGQIGACWPMPTMKNPSGKGNLLDLSRLRGWLLGWRATSVFIEVQQAMPGQGVVSMFSIGKNFGALEGLCVGLSLSYTFVRARAWQKVMLEGVPKGDTKAASVMVAKRLYPDEKFKATDRCTKYHDGMSDSCLIATYGWRQMNGEKG